ncbi:hypothetical protein CPC08DRAFT_768154 [Agrocybe pediades]|nr:hypothetical protein CPC08DRAFT_768154 [Agrocybe pediades]
MDLNAGDMPHRSGAPMHKYDNSMISGAIISGGSYVMNVHRHATRDSLKILKDTTSTAAFHDSVHRFDPPKCHPNTRLSILKQINDWVLGCDPATSDKLVMWLYGPAGAGKSAIAQSVAERLDFEGRLLASFFFSRSDSTRNHSRSLIATLAYQIHCNIPSVQPKIISAIDNDPLIFERTLLAQFATLILDPLRELAESGYFVHPDSRRVIVVDGLDECDNAAEQRDILETLFQSIHVMKSPILFLIASRPEQDILSIFDQKSSLPLHSRLVLDYTLHPENDINLFLRDEFRDIRERHPLRRLLSQSWPEEDVIFELVQKSSGQFIYAATVIKYVKSLHHRPDHRLEVIRKLRPRTDDLDMPFSQLDALYRHILSSVDNIDSVMHLLSFSMHHHFSFQLPISDLEVIIGLEPGSIHLLLSNLGALMMIDEWLEEVKVLHASLFDFLRDPDRSKQFFIDEYSKPELAKHVKNCIRFLSSSKVKDYPDGLLHAMRFFCYNINDLTREMVINPELDLSYLLRLYRHIPEEWEGEHDLISYLKKQFLEDVRLFYMRVRLSQPYLRYRHQMDSTVFPLLEPYFTDRKLSVLLSVALYTNYFPAVVLSRDLQLIDIDFEEDDRLLSILYDGRLPGSPYAYLSRFLRDPLRSKQYCLQNSGRKLFANAVLTCFDFLEGLHRKGEEEEETLPYVRSFEDLELNSLEANVDDATVTAQITTKENIVAEPEHAGDVMLGYVLSTSPEGTEVSEEEEAEDARSSHSHTTSSSNETRSSESSELDEMEEILLEEQRLVDSYSESEPTTEDMAHWRVNWQDPLSGDEHETPLYDELFFKEKFPSSYQFLLPARYYLMLGCMIFFLPRAGWSEQLMKLCRETVLLDEPKLFPVQTRGAQRAMQAYVERMQPTEELLRTLD